MQYMCDTWWIPVICVIWNPGPFSCNRRNIILKIRKEEGCGCCCYSTSFFLFFFCVFFLLHWTCYSYKYAYIYLIARNVLQQIKRFIFHSVRFHTCRYDQQPDRGIPSAVSVRQCVQNLKIGFPLSYEISNTVNNVLMNTTFQFVSCKPDSSTLCLGPVSYCCLHSPQQYLDESKFLSRIAFFY
jgi:hypothetical protein